MGVAPSSRRGVLVDTRWCQNSLAKEPNCCPFSEAGDVGELAEGFGSGRLACVADTSRVVQDLSCGGSEVSVWCDQSGVFLAARRAIGPVAKGRAAFAPMLWPSVELESAPMGMDLVATRRSEQSGSSVGG